MRQPPVYLLSLRMEIFFEMKSYSRHMGLKSHKNRNYFGRLHFNRSAFIPVMNANTSDKCY